MRQPTYYVVEGNKKIVLLASDGPSTRIIYNSLAKQFCIHTVILEDKENKKIFIKRRIRKLGIFKVAGQIAFQLFAVKLLNIVSAKRISQIIKENCLDIQPIPKDKIVRVTSINEKKVLDLLQQIDPAVILVNGTRIISAKILDGVKAPFINTHTGITPMYRGVHGGYWALVNNDIENCGVTIHRVDSGIDTGEVLYQEKISPSKVDNFVTYPFLQTAKALELLPKAIEDALAGDIISRPKSGFSKLWYHPTLPGYIYNRIFKRVK